MASNAHSAPSTTIVTTTRLSRRSQSSWVSWYAQLQYNCMFRGIWAEVNPDGPGSSKQAGILSPPTAPTAQQLVDAENKRRSDQYEDQMSRWEALSEAIRGPEPSAPQLATKRDINAKHLEELRKEYTVEIAEWNVLSSRRTSIWDWILHSVDHDLLSPIMEELTLHLPSTGTTEPSAISLQAIVRLLKRDCAPSETMIETSIRSEYREILASAENQDPLYWYGKWHQAYVRGKARNIPEVTGMLAAQDFLVAVGKRFAPDWARRQLEDLAFSQNEQPSRSLEQLGQIFAAQMHQGITINRAAPGIFAFQKQGPEALRSIQYICPCQGVPSDPHKHPPEQCEKLHKGIRDNNARICKLLQKERYLDLRAKLQANGTRIPTGDESTASLFPGKLVV